MTVKDLKNILKDVDENLPVAVFYDLNDWPGDDWAELNANFSIVKPSDLTKTGSADPASHDLTLVFDVRPQWT